MKLSLRATIDDNTAAIRAAMSSDGMGPECFFMWGDLRGLPESARAMTLDWGGAPLAGAGVCGESAANMMKAPRLRQLAILRFRDGEFEVGHPSDTSAFVPLDLTSSHGSLGTFATFAPDRDPGFEMLSTVHQLPRVFVTIAWEVG